MSDNGRTRLTSWKEIAAYLRREVRTVIRWEKERGLPVHRVPGGHGRSVFAFTDELDRWAAGETGKAAAEAASTNAKATPRGLLMAAVAIVVLIVSAAAAGLAPSWHRELAKVSVTETAIVAHDETGRTLWSHRLPGRADSIRRRVAQLIDLTGDRHTDAVATASVSSPEHEVGIGLLYALDEGGRLLWHRSLDQRLSFGAGDYDGPWVPDDLMTFSNGGEPFVAWSVHDFTWWPSMLVVFDARGSRVGTFTNAGWIRSSRATADGRHIVTAGFSNSRGGAAFAILDARRPEGASPEDPGSPYECRNCPPGRPLRYFVIEWADVVDALPPDQRDAMVSIAPGSGTIELRATQRRQVELIVELAPDFTVTKRAASDAFWEWHRQLEQNGTLTHNREHCPHRDGPTVREWSPSGGWKTH